MELSPPIVSKTQFHQRTGQLIGAPIIVTVAILIFSKALAVGITAGLLLALSFWLSLPRKVILNDTDVQIIHFFKTITIPYHDVIEVHRANRFMAKEDILIIARVKHKILRLPFSGKGLGMESLLAFFKAKHVRVNSI